MFFYLGKVGRRIELLGIKVVYVFLLRMRLVSRIVRVLIGIGEGFGVVICLVVNRIIFGNRSLSVFV